jgi:uncharacterized protein
MGHVPAGLKPSQFNVTTVYPETSELLVLNTSSGALAAFDPDDRETVEAVLAGATAAAHPELLDLLVQQGFLVGGDLDEFSQVTSWNDLGIHDPNRLDVFVLPNMNCNFACPYCYEDHRPSQMSDEVANRILRWFEVAAPRTKLVLLSWFGGEPLLSFDRLVSMQRDVKELCERVGTGFNSHITTNGYLLTPARAQVLLDAGLRSYQITVDGPPDVHNDSRVLRGPGNSFERVFGNLCALAELEPKANIKLRVNFTPTTLNRVPELLELVPAHLRGSMHLVLERIFGDEGLYIGMSPTRLARATERCYDVARSMGFAVTITPLSPGKLTYCYADRDNQILFNHVGDVFKCTVSEFKTEDRLGFLTDDGAISWEGSRRQEWEQVEAFDEKCHTCSFAPMCMGGCRKVRHANGAVGDDCTLPFAALPERMQSRYRSMLGPVPVPVTL